MLHIPLTNDPAQNFSVDLNGVVYEITVVYNTRQATWFIDLASDEFAISGVALLPGANLIQQYPSPLDSLFMINLSDSLDAPSIDTLADQFALVTLTDEEIQEAIV